MPEAPNQANAFHHDHVTRLLHSYRHWTGEDLLSEEPTPIETAYNLFTAPFVVVSHGLGDDPTFNYGNAIALKLFELNWTEFTNMPSRRSAEPVNRVERANILKQVEKDGFCEQYAGVRISSSSRRFQIKNSILWNLQDEDGQFCGQAACFHSWEYL